MKNFSLVLSILFLAITGPILKAQNLVQNGSAEYYDTTTIIPESWTIVSGNWESADHTGHTSDAHDSTHIFYEGIDGFGMLVQDVSISGYVANIDASLQHFFFSAWVQSKLESAPADETSVTIECLDTSKVQVLYSWHSDTIASIGTWTQITSDFLAPPNSRFIRIRLLSFRNQGTENDGYFDDIALIPHTGTYVKNVPQNNNLAITPNPATDRLHVSMTTSGAHELSIRTIRGTTLIKKIVDGPADIDISFLPAGMYFITVSEKDGGGIQTMKFIKN